MNFREKAASFILSNDNIAEALELLDNANDTIPSGVVVWEKFEYDPIESIIEHIDTIAEMLEEAYTQGKTSNLVKKVIVKDLEGLDKDTISKIESPMTYLGEYEESGDVFADLRNSNNEPIRIFHERLKDA